MTKGARPKSKATKDKSLQTISAREFAGRFANGVRVSQQHCTWFFGAGCSKSSGMLDASGLVQKWLAEQHELQAEPGVKFDVWITKAFPEYDADNLAALYAPALRADTPLPWSGSGKSR